MEVPSLAGRVEMELASRESLRNSQPKLKGQAREWGEAKVVRGRRRGSSEAGTVLSYNMVPQGLRMSGCQ